MTDPICCIRQDLRRFGVHPNTIRGQNFLLSAKIRSKIISLAKIDPTDCVLEIGAGTGIMSYNLAKISSNLHLIEIDPTLMQILQSRFSEMENIHMHLDDGVAWLSREWRKLPGTFKIVANLPYGISSPILFTLLSVYPSCSKTVVMLQKDVALRVVAKPGLRSRGVLSVMVQSAYDARIVCDVAKDKFFPQPEVESSVMVLEPKPIPWAVDTVFLEKLVKNVFKHKRKTVLNNLKSAYPKKIIDAVAFDLGEIAGYRPEDLDEEHFEKLSCTIQSLSESEAPEK
ncbi:ribosomal RNA small subunit methyltransferase A [bacterium]|nr:ribosomal RNA small subunit methyltransferase A [candidate division CSSED10-310 bacterium]